MRPLAILTAAALTVGLVASVPAAHAGIGTTTSDPADPDVPGYADVLSFSLTRDDYVDDADGSYHDGVVTAEITLRRAGPHRATDFAYLKAGGRQYAIGSRPSPHGHRSFMVDATAEPGRRVRCPGLDVRYDLSSDRLVIQVPTTCLGSPHRAIRGIALTEDRSGGDLDDTRVLRADLPTSIHDGS